MGLELDMSGLLNTFDTALTRIPEKRRQVLVETGVPTLQQMHEEVPHDTGDLDRSLDMKISADGTEMEVGSFGCEHAVVVHERLLAPSGYPIHYTKPGSKAKFVEDPGHQVGVPAFNAATQKAAKEIFE